MANGEVAETAALNGCIRLQPEEVDITIRGLRAIAARDHYPLTSSGLADFLDEEAKKENITKWDIRCAPLVEGEIKLVPGDLVEDGLIEFGNNGGTDQEKAIALGLLGVIKRAKEEPTTGKAGLLTSSARAIKY